MTWFCFNRKADKKSCKSIFSFSISFFLSFYLFIFPILRNLHLNISRHFVGVKISSTRAKFFMSIEETFSNNNIVAYVKRHRRSCDENCNKSREIFLNEKEKQWWRNLASLTILGGLGRFFDSFWRHLILKTNVKVQFGTSLSINQQKFW